MKDYKALARSTKSDGLFKDRQRHKLEEMAKMYPNGFTVIEFRKLSGPNGPFWLFGYKEDPTSCFGGSTALDKIAEVWSADEDIVQASDGLKASGGVKIVLKPAVTANGRNYFDVVFPD